MASKQAGSAEHDRRAQRRYFKYEARRIVLANWGSMCFAGSAAIVWMAGINTLRAALCGLFGITGTLRAAPVYLLFDLISLLGAAPLFMGFVRYAAGRMGTGIGGDIGGVLYYFRSLTELLGVYRFLYSLLWRLALLFTPTAMLIAAYLYIHGQSAPALFGLHFASQDYRLLTEGALAAAACISAGIALVGAMRYFPAAYMFAYSDTAGTSALMRDASRLSRGRHTDALMLILSFSGWLLISALTFGLALVLFALPYFVCAYVCYCSFICIGTPYGAAVDTEEDVPVDEADTLTMEALTPPVSGVSPAGETHG